MTRIDVQAQRRAKGLFTIHPELKKKKSCVNLKKKEEIKL